ncbi:amidophosphoribosyltransferase [Mycoblastus sanguinarius]|nr:amidophosphoribosyltransferase [Mycoblastus sanguinarius]
MEQQFAGKNVLLVDDSIARGITWREIVLVAKEAGAKTRTVDEIALHIGAERVIFQELDDLIDACRQGAPSDHTARETQDFEVGFFNGQYVTPISDGYFVYLERVRSEIKKIKMIENARGAVANGSVDPEEIKMATNGAEVKDDGSVVASGPLHAGNMPVVNGNHSPLPNAKRKRILEEHKKPKRTMDISMRNQDDLEVED